MVEWICHPIDGGSKKELEKRGKGHKYVSLGQVKELRVLKEGCTCMREQVRANPPSRAESNPSASSIETDEPNLAAHTSTLRLMEEERENGEKEQGRETAQRWGEMKDRGERQRETPPPRHNHGQPCSCGVNKS